MADKKRRRLSKGLYKSRSPIARMRLEVWHLWRDVVGGPPEEIDEGPLPADEPLRFVEVPVAGDWREEAVLLGAAVVGR